MTDSHLFIKKNPLLSKVSYEENAIYGEFSIEVNIHFPCKKPKGDLPSSTSKGFQELNFLQSPCPALWWYP